jgi:hypothetical protein
MRAPRSPVAKARPPRSRSEANAANSAQAAPVITIVSPQLQVPSIKDAWKRAGTLQLRSQRTSKASRTPAASAAVRLQKRPMPHASETEEEK